MGSLFIDKMMKLEHAQKTCSEFNNENLNWQLGEELAESVKEQVVISFKYAGYISQQKDDISRMTETSNIQLPKDFDYNEINALSTEVKQKMNKFKPENIGQASRIQGITPSAISIILIYLKKNRLYKKDDVVNESV